MKIKNIASLAINNYLLKNKPISLVHFVTNRCNARCSFCFIDFDNPETFKNELTLDEIEKLTHSLGSSIQNINITGGEPFARKELTEISEMYFKNSNVNSLFITTNGSLPDRVENYLSHMTKKYPEKKLIFSFSIDKIGKKHDEIRKVKNLFENCLKSYELTKKFGDNVFGNISITVSLENQDEVEEIYRDLIDKHNVKALTACLVRDEGVYKTPTDQKNLILSAYKNLTNNITQDLISGKLEGYNPNTLQGRMMNKKNEIMYDNIISTYLNPHFISTCYAGATFGVIGADGSVYPCEVLDKKIGNLRDHNMNFLELWSGKKARSTHNWIKETKCNCCYECAWSFNILGNYQYQGKLIKAALKK
tara:strand:- start:659 stop:1750 length:1092 start_codon:yes stop_codon:yes gene_type:complete